MRRASFPGLIRTTLGSAILLGVVGCKPSEPQAHPTQKKEGKITRIDAAANRVAMQLRDPKDATRFLDREIEGSLTAKTEIFINGRRSRLEDIKVGDSVSALGHMEGTKENPSIVAEEIQIERLTESFVDVKKPADPAPSQPAPIKPDAAPAEVVTTTLTPNPPAQPPATDTPATNAQVVPAQPNKSLSKIELYHEFIKAFELRRAELQVERDKLLAEGRPLDDPEVQKLENSINKADESIAVVELEARKLGIDPANPGGAAPSSAPAAAPSTQPAGGS